MKVSYTIELTLDDEPTALPSFKISAEMLASLNKSEMPSADRVNLFIKVISELERYVAEKNVPVSISSDVVKYTIRKQE